MTAPAKPSDAGLGPRAALAVDDAQILVALIETSRQPLIVQFRSATERAGKLVSPELDTLAHSTGDWLTVVDACTTSDPAMTERFHLVATPAVVVYCDGAEIARTDGNRQAKELERFTASALEHTGHVPPSSVDPLGSAS